MAVRKKLLEKDNDLTKAQFDELVLETCKEVGKAHWKRLVTVNHKYVSKLLHEQ
jgi:hypothetical protein